MTLLLTLLLLGAEDPRPELIQLQLSGRHETALAQVDEALAANPEAARRWGLEYLRGHLLEILRLEQDAPKDFAAAMTSTPMLAGYSRYRLAVNQYRTGHPEVAAGLMATLLANDPPPPLVETSVRLLASALAQGGDCRLLGGIDGWGLKSAQRRHLQISQADCALASGELERADDVLTRILREDRRDETARAAAERLARLMPASPAAESTLLLGLTFHHHREFRRAIPYLERGLSAAPDATESLRGVNRADALYALARSYFWQGDYAKAAMGFDRAAAEETDSELKARAVFQQARSYELQGDWPTAAATYRRAFAADRSGSWAPAALLGVLRIEWRQGREGEALEILEILRSRRDWRFMAERGILFLVASDTVRGRTDRAAAWIAAAQRTRRGSTLELTYWQGRLAELQGRLQSAVSSYAVVATQDPFHPLAQAAAARLHKPSLTDVARSEGERLTSAFRSQDLHRAWLLLGETDPVGVRARTRLVDLLNQSSRTRSYLEMRAAEPADWAVWQKQPERPEELLIALGIVEQMSPAVRDLFPYTDASLAMSASTLLGAAGLHQPSLYLAEVISKGLPKGLPARLLPLGFRRLLYPRPFHELVDREARRFGVDPDLLTAIIREESRFDPLAISTASARGLTQFVLPTARRIGRAVGWEDLEAADLHRPEMAITLGAAYLDQLSRQFDAQQHVMIAAYNAGEDQARLWLSYCYSREPEEFFSKVGFNQTRVYLQKVSSSFAQYREIYKWSQNDTD